VARSQHIYVAAEKATPGDVGDDQVSVDAAGLDAAAPTGSTEG
jgi:hypothetical protein